MRVIACTDKQQLKLEQREELKFKPNSPVTFARVAVKAFGINRADLLQRAGHYPPPKGVVSDILGLEFAGIIDSFSDGSNQYADYQVGDRVMGICAGAAYAEQVIVPVEHLLPIPQDMSFCTAASIPEAHLTAYDALVTQGRLQVGDEVLIHAIGSGVGCAAAVLADFLGAQVSGTTRSDWKKEKALQSFALQQVYLAKQGQFMPKTEQKRFDLILDFIGAAYFKENLHRLNHQGRLVVIGLLGGIKTELNLALLLAKRAQIIGTVLRSRSIKEKKELTQSYRKNILPFLYQDQTTSEMTNRGIKLEPIYRVYSPNELEEAHLDLAASGVWSKLVCRWD